MIRRNTPLSLLCEQAEQMSAMYRSLGNVEGARFWSQRHDAIQELRIQLYKFILNPVIKN